MEAAALGANTGFNIPVLYDSRMVARGVESFSPSAAKPEAVVRSWERLGLPIQIITPSPVTREQLYAVHDADYVDGVLNCTVPNGFGNTSKEIADSLVWTTGSMLSAAREALRNRSVAVSPSSGYHHAHRGYGAGYCTFEGQLVAALALLNDGSVGRIGLLDCDQHFGDGTDAIISELHLQPRIRHYSVGEKWRTTSRAETFIKSLPCIVEMFSDCDLLIVQLGVDCHVDDPLGGWLDSEQIQQRDRIIFQCAKRLGIPLVWNLAGGYQTPLARVIKLHERTMIACAETYNGEIH
jgi:acetoin utilization deacetylase AcuC-like enzyme